MDKIQTKLGGKEIEVDVEGISSLGFPEDSALKDTTVQSVRFLDTTICEIPDSPDEDIIIPEVPNAPHVQPSNNITMPYSVLASMLPCDEEGHFPCPDIVQNPNQDINNLSETEKSRLNYVAIQIGNASSNIHIEGNLYIDYDIEPKCCCDAEEGENDSIAITPRLAWVPFTNNIVPSDFFGSLLTPYHHGSDTSVGISTNNAGNTGGTLNGEAPNGRIDAKPAPTVKASAESGEQVLCRKIGGEWYFFTDSPEAEVTEELMVSGHPIKGFTFNGTPPTNPYTCNTEPFIKKIAVASDVLNAVAIKFKRTEVQAYASGVKGFPWIPYITELTGKEKLKFTPGYVCGDYFMPSWQTEVVYDRDDMWKYYGENNSTKAFRLTCKKYEDNDLLSSKSVYYSNPTYIYNDGFDRYMCDTTLGKIHTAHTEEGSTSMLGPFKDANGNTVINTLVAYQPTPWTYDANELKYKKGNNQTLDLHFGDPVWKIGNEKFFGSLIDDDRTYATYKGRYRVQVEAISGRNESVEFKDIRYDQSRSKYVLGYKAAKSYSSLSNKKDVIDVEQAIGVFVNTTGNYLSSKLNPKNTYTFSYDANLSSNRDYTRFGSLHNILRQKASIYLHEIKRGANLFYIPCNKLVGWQLLDTDCTDEVTFEFVPEDYWFTYIRYRIDQINADKNADKSILPTLRNMLQKDSKGNYRLTYDELKDYYTGELTRLDQEITALQAEIDSTAHYNEEYRALRNEVYDLEDELEELIEQLKEASDENKEAILNEIRTTQQTIAQKEILRDETDALATVNTNNKNKKTTLNTIRSFVNNRLSALNSIDKEYKTTLKDILQCAIKKDDTQLKTLVYDKQWKLDATYGQGHCYHVIKNENTMTKNLEFKYKEPDLQNLTLEFLEFEPRLHPYHIWVFELELLS